VTAFATAPVLRLFDPEKEGISETNVSNDESAGVSSQYDDDRVLHPVAYSSKNYSPAECNYHKYTKELIAIVEALEEWRPECEGAAYSPKLTTDCKNMEYFMTKELSNQRQARCSEFLTRFDYLIVYRPGKLNGQVDALTRKPGDVPEGR